MKINNYLERLGTECSHILCTSMILVPAPGRSNWGLRQHTIHCVGAGNSPSSVNDKIADINEHNKIKRSVLPSTSSAR